MAKGKYRDKRMAAEAAESGDAAAQNVSAPAQQTAEATDSPSAVQNISAGEAARTSEYSGAYFDRAPGEWVNNPTEGGAAPVYDVPEFTEEDEGDVPMMKRMIDLEFQRQKAEMDAGKERSVYGFWGLVWRFMTWYDKIRVEHTFKKRTYLWLMLFTGWMGGHRWYQGRRILGLIETAFFWTGIPMLLVVTDFMEVYPIKADENGMITMK